MSVNLQKGQKVSLTKQNSPTKLRVGLGWDVSKIKDKKFDLDAHAYMLDANGKLIGSEGHVYYGNLRFKDAVVHSGDNLTGAGDGDDEQIIVDLSKIPDNVKSIKFAVIIYAARERKEDFSMVENAYIHIDNCSPTEELCRYQLGENYVGKDIVLVGEIYRHGEDWKFNAIGQGTNSTNEFLK